MLRKSSRPKEAQRTVAAVTHPDTKAQLPALDGGRPRAEFHALESRWSFLERLCAPSFGFTENRRVVK